MTALMELPLELTENIFQYLDNESLLAFREVSKITKKLAEMAVLNRTAHPEIGKLVLFAKNDSEIVVAFSFDRVEKYNQLPSKIFLLSVINYLQVRGFHYQSQNAFMTINPTETIAFFNKLTPLMDGISFTSLELYPTTLEMFSLTSNFFAKKTVSELVFTHDELEQINYFPLRLINHLQSTAVRVQVINSVSDDFLDIMAGIVDSITITVENKNWISNSRVIEFSHLILKSRCSYLVLSEANVNFSIADACCLSFILESIGSKPFYFAAHTSQKRFFMENSAGHVIEVVEDEEFIDKRRIEVRNPKRK